MTKTLFSRAAVKPHIRLPNLERKSARVSPHDKCLAQLIGCCVLSGFLGEGAEFRKSDNPAAARTGCFVGLQAQFVMQPGDLVLGISAAVQAQFYPRSFRLRPYFRPGAGPIG